VTPTFHPRLVNGRFGDPALFVEILHRREALLFDLGELTPLSTRDLLRVSHVFVSHMHMDHFVGFDALLRVHIGREKVIRIVGPEGIATRVHHKLQGYEWDLVEKYDVDLVFEVVEVGSSGPCRAERFRFRRRFEREEIEVSPPGPVASGDGFTVEAALLEHHGPCLGFALSEPAHANVWKVRLQERGLATGPWLHQLKTAVIAGAPDDTRLLLPDGRSARLAELRDLVIVGPGQKVAYVTDVADTPANRAAIARLASGADLFFCESRFAAADEAQARERAHLTTTATGEIARAAGVRRLEPFHFSPRYEGEEERMIAEVMAAFMPPLHFRGEGRGEGESVCSHSPSPPPLRGSSTPLKGRGR
jgi:ribonuclease Z